MTRVAVLVDEFDKRLGCTSVPERTFVIRHGDERFFFRTEQAVRLPGGGIGVVFREVDVLVRNRLEAR